MNFILEWSTRYLTSERSEQVIYRVEHEKIKFLSIREYVIFCLLYKHQWNIKSVCSQRRDLLCNYYDGDLRPRSYLLTWRVFTWEDMKLSRESSLGISLIINLNLKDILIGLLTPERPLLNYLLLIGKIYLWVCRRNKELPSIRGFQSKVKLKYEGGFHCRVIFTCVRT